MTINDDAREEALRESAALGQADKVLFYLETVGVDIDAQNKVNGWTALHWASSRGNAEIVSLLLGHGADEKLKNFKGQAPVELAKRDEVRELFTTPPLPTATAAQPQRPPTPPPAFVPAYLATPVSDLLFSVPVSEQPGFASAGRRAVAELAGPVSAPRPEPTRPAAPVVAVREEVSSPATQKPSTATAAAPSNPHPPQLVDSTRKDLIVHNGIPHKELLVYINYRDDAQLTGAIFVSVGSTIKDLVAQIDRELLAGSGDLTRLSRHNGAFAIRVPPGQWEQDALLHFHGPADAAVVHIKIISEIRIR
ncbi:Ankyrin repeat domain-containing protein 40 [Geranomyces variabilis]|uniref:Ankyrin repeat domain-containing protein 40 n=1 Tax=Geranomyces variabilis TaxID=109894 RepID=A0AAD5XSX4_9FUNG|nr:Ankyrin repeat domain-containing protein 40 [Geranomyces variabilis]